MSKKLFTMLPEPPPTFDQILPIIMEWLQTHKDSITGFLNTGNNWLLINRDLNGRVRLILPEAVKTSELHGVWQHLAARLMHRLKTHSYPENAAILFEEDKDQACQGATVYSIDGFEKVWMIDRLATEANWANIDAETQGPTRVVFFSIKGGVGRSTALAATAWSLAQAGKRVLVLDLDLESPGLSSALLPLDRQPKYGIVDWLVEDLVDNADSIFNNMVANSNLSHDGEIHVVPAHGADHGEYISKLGRVWMPKLQSTGEREPWSARLNRLLIALEANVQPDIVLIDSRSGIDEIASACITDMGANLILLFAIEGEQTWNGYRMLFEQWQRAHVAEKIRERLKVVGAVVPELNKLNYLEGLREHAYEIFVDTLYDEIPPAGPNSVGRTENDEKWHVGELVEGWSFDGADEGAPHYPWAVNWHRSFAGLRSLQGRLATIDAQEVQSVFGPLIEGVGMTISSEQTS